MIRGHIRMSDIEFVQRKWPSAHVLRGGPSYADMFDNAVSSDLPFKVRIVWFNELSP
jgi:hypothetical protein